MYQLSHKQDIPKYESTLPIHRKIYDKANMEMYELYKRVKDANPECELVGIKTDCLVFNNLSTHVKTSHAWGGAKKVDPPLIKDCTIGQPPKIRTDVYDVTYTEWNRIDAGSIE